MSTAWKLKKIEFDRFDFAWNSRFYKGDYGLNKGRTVSIYIMNLWDETLRMGWSMGKLKTSVKY